MARGWWLWALLLGVTIPASARLPMAGTGTVRGVPVLPVPPSVEGVPALSMDTYSRLGLLVRQSVGAPPLQGYAVSPLSLSVSELLVRREEVPRLLAEPTVLRIDGLRRLTPLLDQSRNLIGAKAVTDQLQLRGKGVMIGIVDTGIDFRHADLRDAAGKTRIAYLLSRSGRSISAGMAPTSPGLLRPRGWPQVVALPLDGMLGWPRKPRCVSSRPPGMSSPLMMSTSCAGCASALIGPMKPSCRWWST